MTTEEWTIDKAELYGQILAQISALSDKAKEITEHTCGQVDTPSLKRMHVRAWSQHIYGLIACCDAYLYAHHPHQLMQATQTHLCGNKPGWAISSGHPFRRILPG